MILLRITRIYAWKTSFNQSANLKPLHEEISRIKIQTFTEEEINKLSQTHEYTQTNQCGPNCDS